MVYTVEVGKKRFLCKEDVNGSSPLASIECGQKHFTLSLDKSAGMVYIIKPLVERSFLFKNETLMPLRDTFLKRI